MLIGSRRPSLASIHSTTSSARSYSARRLEKERNEKEQRQELKILKQKQDLEDTEQCQQISTAPSPSPRTPHSTDDLLPSVEEGKEFFYNEVMECLFCFDHLESSFITMITASVNGIGHDRLDIGYDDRADH